MHTDYSSEGIFKKMATAKLTWMALYDIFTGAYGVNLFVFMNIELTMIERGISVIVFIALVVLRIILVWEDVKKRRLENKEREFNVNTKIKAGLGVIMQPQAGKMFNSFDYFNQVNESIQRIFHATKADRFLIIRANNGKTDFKFASVIYEQHKESEFTERSIGAAERYTDYIFDKDYEEKIKQCEKYGVIDLITAQLPEGTSFKTIYTSESVTHSRVYFLTRQPFTEGKDALIYCSVATHAGTFTNVENVAIKLEIEAIKAKTKRYIR